MIYYFFLLQNNDIPVYLLRNVCFFCDSNGLQSIAVCFDKANTEVLPYNVAHTLINIIANVSKNMTHGLRCAEHIIML